MNSEIKSKGLRGPRRLLARIRDLMADQDDAQARLDTLTDIIAEETQADVCSIYLMRPSGALELSATHGLNPEAVHRVRLSRDEGLVGLVARRARPIAVEDAPRHPDFSYKPETGEEPFKSFVGVPILRGGRLVGVLTHQTKAVRPMTEEEIETLQTVAMLLAEIVVSGDLVKAEAFSGLELRPSAPERFQGVALSSGIAVGTAVMYEPHVISARMVAEDAEAELVRLDAAIGRLRASVDQLLDSGRVPIGSPSRDVLEAYRMFAHDRGWLDSLREAIRSGLTAEAAVERVRNEHRARLMTARDPHFRERLHDLEDLANRLLRHLASETGAAVERPLPQDAIIIARSIGPAELLELDRSRLKGVALEEGSPTSHAAIVAKALRVPMVGRVEGALDRIEDGDRVILDGEFGLLHARPSGEVGEAYDERLETLAKRHRTYVRLREEPAVTKDGARIELHLNAGLLVELTSLPETGAEGIGLFRTEFQFMVSDTLPRLAAQEELYRAVYEAAGPKPVVFRTLDLGGDKITPYTPSTREPNPALGWRALRMGLDRPGLTRYQLRALIRASAGRDLRVLFPMVADVSELAAARTMLEQELEHALKHGHPPPASVQAGLMLETPAVAFAPDACLELADFVAVGANDLMQYFFAADRQNPKVAERYDVLAPAPLSLLKSVRDACDRHGKPVSVCGEIAGRPLEACVLAALGYRRLSMTAAAVGPVKRALRQLDCGRLGTWLAREMAETNGSSGPGLRMRLLEAGEKAGLPVEAVDKPGRL
ncbi:phosphoenolpyruvate--protein phosphotransferase [Marinicauda algicola]|uniref:phosphoenolpyruvate--protein phosphotransferase n=1 Tax=Marinicauda algicola TaxID=2029849 RepID=A0A4S2GXR0_9PROT|nr:phosphoenolpyruvate--protein phosphotransferase [Marinicauda algicola]TGY87562.1 phosphoenolpyruvate--protein phosphotransferase [Marinicauda algicola]